MMLIEKNHLLERISKIIHQKDLNAEAYLFGSRARGDSRPNSDWDVMILVDEIKVTNAIEDKFRDELYDLEVDSGQVISIFVYPKKDWNKMKGFSPLHDNVSREGIRL